MGRRKKEIQRLQTGVVYRLDRRRKTFSLVRKVISRQDSKNWKTGNIIFIDVQAPPVMTTVMTLEHSVIFGTDYVKLFVSSTSGQHEMGYLNLTEFLSLICGKPEWITLQPPPSPTPTST